MSKKLIKFSFLVVGLVSSAIVAKIGMSSLNTGNVIDVVHADTPAGVGGGPWSPDSGGGSDGCDGPCDGM